MERVLILADNQEITKEGLSSLAGKSAVFNQILEAGEKKVLSSLLKLYPESLVIIDYTLFDFNSAEELINIGDRFPDSSWILFSDELSESFLKMIVFESRMSVLMKGCQATVIKEAIRKVQTGERFICPQIESDMKSYVGRAEEVTALTNTEKEILKLVAQGKSVKEIASERFSSNHTIITHKKNIFRKISVNNIHEATKYAIRAGLIDPAEYFI
jgi:DNA-binding NarL/FixJ family response regulator